MLWYSPLLTLIAIGVSLLPILVSLITSGKITKAETAVSEQNKTFVGLLKDVLTGFTVVKSFRSEKEISQVFHDVTKDTEEKNAIKAV